MSRYLLIDTSYAVFFRFFATKVWYNLAHPEDKFEEEYDWYQNEIFLNSFKKNFYKSIEKIVKKYDIDGNRIIFARDCPRESIWRMDFYSEYKANRVDKYGSAKGQINVGPFFKEVYNNILPELRNKLKCMVFKKDRLEADDVIALTKEYLQTCNPDHEFIIITSDHDLMQLIDNKTTLINLKNKILNKKSCGNPKHDLEIKIICGDKSDNIPGCFKRCGQKTAMKCILDKAHLQKMFKSNPGSFDTYAKNKLIIDFSNIPIELKNEFIAILKSSDL